MQLPVTLALHPSRRLSLLLLAIHGGALGLVVAIPLSPWVKLILLLGVLWSAWRAANHIQGRQRIVRLTLRGDGLVDYHRFSGQGGESRIHPHTTVMPWLTVVLLRSYGQLEPLEPLVLLPDSLAAEEFRKLRLWLRCQAVLD